MQIPLVDLKIQYEHIKGEIDSAISAVLAETAFVRSHFVEKFEFEFAAYIGTRHCIGCANGTDAIEILLEAFGIGKGDEAIVPANTFFATAEAVARVGATPVFVDNEPRTYSIDVQRIEEKINSRTKCIIPVHLYGVPCDMDAINVIAKRHCLLVIEDASQAHGALYKGRKVGCLGDAATFSFFPGKNLGAYGDAGGIVVNDEQLAKKCRQIGNHGGLKKYEHDILGRNSRLDGLQASVLSVKLKFLDGWNASRRRLAARYSELLQDSEIGLPFVPPHCESAFHLYVVRVAARDVLLEKLTNAGIGAGIHYPTALPYLAPFRSAAVLDRDYPNALSQMSQILSLPLFPELSEKQLQHVTDIVISHLAASHR